MSKEKSRDGPRRADSYPGATKELSHDDERRRSPDRKLPVLPDTTSNLPSDLTVPSRRSSTIPSRSTSSISLASREYDSLRLLELRQRFRMSHNYHQHQQQQQNSQQQQREATPSSMMQSRQHRVGLPQALSSRGQPNLGLLGASMSAANSSVPGPHFYNSQSDFIRSGLLGLESNPPTTLSQPGQPYGYDEIDLTDPDAANALLMRSDLMAASDSLLQQQQQRAAQDLRAPQDLQPPASLAMPNFIVPPRSLLAARQSLLSGQDHLSALFDQQSTGFDTTPSTTYTPSSAGLLPNSSASPSPTSSNFLLTGANGNSAASSRINGRGNRGDNGNTNGGSGHQQRHPPHPPPLQRPLPSSTSSTPSGPLPLLVKQEADEGHFVEDDNLSRSSVNSPTKSENSSDSHMFAQPPDDRKRALKRSISECSATSSGQDDNGGCSKPKQSSSHGAAEKNGCDSGGNGTANSSSGSNATLPTTSASESGGSSNMSPTASADSAKERDPAYLEKRRKNNESAKRSREARRTKEELVAFKVINLEEENMKLRAEIRLLDKELDELRTRLYQCN